MDTETGSQADSGHAAIIAPAAYYLFSSHALDI